jgi:hypothetical protein
MGAWAAGNFSNDVALTFVEGLKDTTEIGSTVVEINRCTEELDVDQSCVALAACDLLAAIMGRPAADLPDGLDLEVEVVRDAILDVARSLVERVRETSELAEAWKEDDASEWYVVLDDLLQRLTPSAPNRKPKKKTKPKLPDDFIGYCYICYGMVTERNGIFFEYTDADSVTSACYPHRQCIEDKVSGPYWNEDGSPTRQTRTKLLQDMGYDVED